MSHPKGSHQSRDTAPRRAEASAAVGASSLKPTQGQASTATQYWQGVAAAGRAVKPPTAPSTEAAASKRQRSVRA